MASKFVDPVANAGTIGFILMLLGFVKLLSGDFSPINLGVMVLYLAIGFGLWKKKVWGLYLFGVLATLSVLLFLYFFSLGVPLFPAIIDPILTVGLFTWFWSARTRFNQ